MCFFLNTGLRFYWAFVRRSVVASQPLGVTVVAVGSPSWGRVTELMGVCDGLNGGV